MSGFPVPSGTFVATAGTYATAATVVESAQVTGDTVTRYTQGADGKLSWGPGNAGIDSQLSREGPYALAVVGAMRASTELAAREYAGTQVDIGAVGPASQSGIRFQNNEAGSNLYRSAAGVLKTDGALVIGTRPAFVAADKYLVVDSTGAVHVSALGPAS